MHYTRTDWGARPAKPGPGGFSASDVKGAALHWPSGPVPDDAKAALRSYQRYHMDGQGWSDIAYNFAFDQDGNVYDLRGWNVRSGANGDTQPNREYVAFLLLVGPGEAPSAKLIAAVREYVGLLRRRWPKATLIRGHRDVRPEGTECPGPLTYALIQSGAFEPRPVPPKRPESEEDELTPEEKKMLREIHKVLTEPLELESAGARKVLGGKEWTFRHLLEVGVSNVVALARRG